MQSTISSLSPDHWVDYELIDTGGFEKLERFGAYVLSRPEPQAIWDKSLNEAEWRKLAHAHFAKEKGNPEKGNWEILKKMPQNWEIQYKNPMGLRLTLNLSLTSFKHIGIFPEQAVNWDYLSETLPAFQGANPKVLNLFAYTGAASVAARAHGAEVTHLDAVRQVITWSKFNMEASGQSDIRWIIDDALKYAQREVRRGNQYQGIILDPPAYGRGPKGEKWVLEENINELLKLCGQLLDPERNFFILNLYSLSFSSLIAENLVKGSFKSVLNPSHGELFLQDNFGKKLPLGIFYRFRSMPTGKP
ncbi:putative oxidoreductase [Lunatimonas lonarensis]|uniref:Putative oxidoreductase n=1 Tax=Lunatimonas lonarensis TaxID=1232681 RepID=R7ZVU9_9BACT|nr:class I SAM-dependent methyltransferase [Lunatimonas lonarensis]EON78114.1 putative oxidoreductase [Lunatimonas lonarensis]